MRSLMTSSAPAPTAPRLLNILKDVERVRPLPVSVSRVIQALEDPTVDAEYIAHLLGLDQALAADVLRLSNAAALSGVTATASVQEAVMRLGFKRVKNLALGAATATLLTRRLGGYGLSSSELWNHSVETASLARYVADAVGYRDLDEAYVAGLLHDIGKLILDQYVKVGQQVLADLMVKNRWQLWQAEEHVFGLDHGAVGGRMAEKWQFPIGLVEAIRCHHWPSLSRTRPELAAIVNIADALPGRRRSSSFALLGAASVHPEALRLLGLDETRFARLRIEMPWQPGL